MRARRYTPGGSGDLVRFGAGAGAALIIGGMPTGGMPTVPMGWVGGATEAGVGEALFTFARSRYPIASIRMSPSAGGSPAPASCSITRSNLTSAARYSSASKLALASLYRRRMRSIRIASNCARAPGDINEGSGRYRGWLNRSVSIAMRAWSVRLSAKRQRMRYSVGSMSASGPSGNGALSRAESASS